MTVLSLPEQNFFFYHPLSNRFSSSARIDFAFTFFPYAFSVLPVFYPSLKFVFTLCTEAEPCQEIQVVDLEVMSLEVLSDMVLVMYQCHKRSRLALEVVVPQTLRMEVDLGRMETVI